MVLAALMVGLGALFLGPAGLLLDGARWQSRSPRAAIALWQSIGLAGGICFVAAGLAVAVARFHDGFLGGLQHLVHELTGPRPLAGITILEALGLTLATDISLILLGGLILTVVRTMRVRSRHRRVLDLVGLTTERVPGTVILDHPNPAAYYLPGFRSRIVISSGTLRVLDPTELAAVVSHEHGHAREHHGLLMLPFTSLAHLFSWIPYSRRAPRTVARLVELAADDHAARRHDPFVLASALVQLSTSNLVPSCSFGAGGPDVASRVHRLLEESRTSRMTAVTAGFVAALVLALPMGALWLR